MAAYWKTACNSLSRLSSSENVHLDISPVRWGNQSHCIVILQRGKVSIGFKEFHRFIQKELQYLLTAWYQASFWISISSAFEWNCEKQSRRLGKNPWSTARPGVTPGAINDVGIIRLCVHSSKTRPTMGCLEICCKEITIIKENKNDYQAEKRSLEVIDLYTASPTRLGPRCLFRRGAYAVNSSITQGRTPSSPPSSYHNLHYLEFHLRVFCFTQNKVRGR